MPEIIERLPLGVPDFSERLMRAMDIKGDLPGELSGLFLPMIIAEDLTLPEYFWSRRGRSFQCFVSAGAVAAQNAVFELQAQAGNPDVMAIIDRVILTNTQAAFQPFRFGLNATKQLAAVALTPTATDERQLGQTSAYKAFGGNVAYANNAAQMVVNVPAQSTVIVAGPWILTGFNAGAGAFAAFIDAVNVAGAFGCTFRERQIINAER